MDPARGCITGIVLVTLKDASQFEKLSPPRGGSRVWRGQKFFQRKIEGRGTIAYRHVTAIGMMQLTVSGAKGVFWAIAEGLWNLPFLFSSPRY